MTHLARIAAKLFNTPLLLLPEMAITIASNLADRLAVEPVGASGMPLQGFEATQFRGKPSVKRLADGSAANMYSVDNGVAIIPVMGELVNRGAWIGADSGLTSYEGFNEQLRAAVSDPNVRGILLDMDSPGGEAAGAMEAGAAVRAASAQKKVVAFVNGMAASAAYAVASGASQIVTAPSGLLGSVGVLLLHVDRSEQLAKAGLKPTLIQAGAYKTDYSGLRALPEGARARIQASVDGLYDMFVSTVAAHRGIPEAGVRAIEGGLLMGREAIAAGLADSEGTFEDAMALFDVEIVDMDTISKAEHEAKLKETQDSAMALASQAETTGKQAAKERLKAILGSDAAKGRAELADYLAYETDMAADQALAMLAKAPTSAVAAVDVAPAKPRLEVPVPAIDPDPGRKAADDGLTPWADIVDAMNQEAAATRPGFVTPRPRN